MNEWKVKYFRSPLVVPRRRLGPPHAVMQVSPRRMTQADSSALANVCSEDGSRTDIAPYQLSIQCDILTLHYTQ